MLATSAWDGDGSSQARFAQVSFFAFLIGSLQKILCKDIFAYMAHVVPLTPESFKGLAHPMRVALLTLLRADGPATASQLAEALDTTSGATSYHLRQLARHGFIEEQVGTGSARERYWSARHLATKLNRGDLAEDPESLALLDEIMRAISMSRESEVQAFLATQDEWGPEWEEAVALDDHFIRMNAAELAQLRGEISERLFELAQRPSEKTPEDAVPVRVHFLAFPFGSYRDEIKKIAEDWELGR